MRQGHEKGRDGRGSIVITQFKVRWVRANCKLRTATPAKPPSSPLCIWQFDNNAGAGRHSGANTND